MNKGTEKGIGCTKWAVGCGLTLFIAVLIFTGLAYLGFKMSGGAYSGVKRMTEIVTLDNEIINHSKFTSPEDGLMSLEQVQTLIYVQTQIKDAIGEDYQSLILEYQRLIVEMKDISDLKRFRQLISLSGHLMKPLHRAKKAQVDAINREGVSLAEYEWLKSQAITALDLSIYKINFRDVINHLKQDPHPEEMIKKPEVSDPQNTLMLEPHRELLTETLALSAMGI